MKRRSGWCWTSQAVTGIQGWLGCNFNTNSSFSVPTITLLCHHFRSVKNGKDLHWNYFDALLNTNFFGPKESKLWMLTESGYWKLNYPTKFIALSNFLFLNRRMTLNWICICILFTTKGLFLFLSMFSWTQKNADDTAVPLLFNWDLFWGSNKFGAGGNSGEIVFISILASKERNSL